MTSTHSTSGPLLLGHPGSKALLTPSPDQPKTEITKSGTLTLHLGGSCLPEGLVPPGVLELKLDDTAPKFSAKAIRSVDHLMIADLNADQSFPKTLKKLFLTRYTGSTPLPRGCDVFINFANRTNVGPGHKHYLFSDPSSQMSMSNASTENYMCMSEPVTINAFGCDYKVIKRVSLSQPLAPRPKTPLFLFRLNIGNAELKPEHIGSIKELKLTGSPTFKAATIAGLDSLIIDDLNEHMSFPETLKWLIIGNYSGVTPLPKIKGVCVHAGHCEKITTDTEHHIFYYGHGGVHQKNDETFECIGKHQTITVGSSDFSVLKREPKVKPVPAPVLAPDVNTKILEELTNLQKAITDMALMLASSKV